MIISLSGSQGQGKTTVLESLRCLGYSVVEQKTSRSILGEWGFTLNEVNKYPPLTKQFQREVIKRHFGNMEALIDTTDIHLMERSFADIFAYCMFAIGSFNEYDAFMDEYFIQCKTYQQAYRHVFYLTGRKIVPEDDGVRSTNKFFAQAVDREIWQMLQQMDDLGRLTLVNTSDHDERIALIENTIHGGATYGN